MSQRDRATLLVIEYFAKSLKALKFIRNDTAEYGVYKSLIAFYWNYVYIIPFL